MKNLFAPQYEELSNEKIFEKAWEYNGVKLYLPDDRDRQKLPKHWLLNVFLRYGSYSSNWITQEMNSSNYNLADKRDLLIDLDPEVARVFAAST